MFFCWLPTDIIICTGLEDGFACYSSDQEGVQKVFGTLDLFVSLLETEIKYPILQGGILPFWTPSSIIG